LIINSFVVDIDLVILYNLFINESNQGVKMDRVNRYSYTEKCCNLSNAFGLELAIKKFNVTEEELAKLVGRFKRGPRKGLLKGKISWLKITKGGWVKTGSYDFDEMKANGFVFRMIGFCFGFRITINSVYSNKMHEDHILGYDFDKFPIERSLLQDYKKYQEKIKNKG
jgi:hypothetical protein